MLQLPCESHRYHCDVPLTTVSQIDTYLANAASALAINTVARSTFGAGFPLFGGQMYTKLGTLGASFLLGGLAILCVPIPFLLMKYGRKLRGMSKHAVVRAHE
jgi:predicted phage tail protein